AGLRHRVDEEGADLGRQLHELLLAEPVEVARSVDTGQHCHPFLPLLPVECAGPADQADPTSLMFRLGRRWPPRAMYVTAGARETAGPCLEFQERPGGRVTPGPRGGAAGTGVRLRA